MPEISSFFGVRVTMYYDDHNPPHFHAEYQDNKILDLAKNDMPLNKIAPLM